MQELDQEIAQLCTELLEVKRRGALERAPRRNEKALLRARYYACKGRWRHQLFNTDSNSTELAVYRDELKALFDDPDIPPCTLNQEAQLCRHIHVMTIAEQELLEVVKETRNAVEIADREIRRLQEERTDIEVKYLNKIFELEREIQETQQQLDDYPLVDPTEHPAWKESNKNSNTCTTDATCVDKITEITEDSFSTNSTCTDSDDSESSLTEDAAKKIDHSYNDAAAKLVQLVANHRLNNTDRRTHYFN